jgi:hypothetical protein
MLQKKSVCFQGFPNSAGKSVRHGGEAMPLLGVEKNAGFDGFTAYFLKAAEPTSKALSNRPAL